LPLGVNKMKVISDKEKTIKKWTSTEEYKHNYDSIFGKKEKPNSSNELEEKQEERVSK